MNKNNSSHDPELRHLLDSLGLPEFVSLESPPEQSQALLDRIIDQPKQIKPQGQTRVHTALKSLRWPGLGLVVAAMLALVLVLGPSLSSGPGRAPSASASTPPLLHFSRLTHGVGKFEGVPARESLEQLSSRAAKLSDSHGEVQHIQVVAWWASTDPATTSEDATTVLIPRQVDVYQLPDDTRRAIERRGAPLDSAGRATKQSGSWTSVAPTSDEAFPNERGADFADSLPTESSLINREFAPAGACDGMTGGCLLNGLKELATNYVVPPTVQAAFLTALADEPSISSLGTTTDRLGRRALAISAPDIDSTRRIIVLLDLTAGRFLGSETVLIAEDPALGFEPPAVVEFSAVAAARWINAAQVPDDSETVRYE